MNKIRLLSLKIDDVHLAFKPGLNYIVGKNNTGKTTIFNCIKYVLGLSKSSVFSDFYRADLEVRIGETDFVFSRDVGDLLISVCVDGADYQFRPMSKELNDFLSAKLCPKFIFGREFENIFTLLEFCFLSEERSASRRQQWEAMNLVCGINTSLISFLEKDINSLKKEVSRNKEIQESVEEFLGLLLRKLNDLDKGIEIDESIEITKAEYFSKFLRDEELLASATRKLDDIKSRSEKELGIRISEVEKVFVSLKNFAGYQRWTINNLEAVINGRNSYMSYGEEIFSKFILVLAIAKASQDREYNFPSIIINDSYLSGSLDEGAYKSALEILKDMTDQEKGLQYIEFTHRDDIPKEHVVLNLNSRGSLHVFRG